eukprot:scaffold127187_cov29-Tisochrysis_lutea.AAC.5
MSEPYIISACLSPVRVLSRCRVPLCETTAPTQSAHLLRCAGSLTSTPAGSLTSTPAGSHRCWAIWSTGLAVAGGFLSSPPRCSR